MKRNGKMEWNAIDCAWCTLNGVEWNGQVRSKLSSNVSKLLFVHIHLLRAMACSASRDCSCKDDPLYYDVSQDVQMPRDVWDALHRVQCQAYHIFGWRPDRQCQCQICGLYQSNEKAFKWHRTWSVAQKRYLWERLCMHCWYYGPTQHQWTLWVAEEKRKRRASAFLPY